MRALRGRVGRTAVQVALSSIAISLAAPTAVFAAATLVSINATGTASGNGESSGPWGVSETGRYVCFDSTADDLVAGDTNGTGDVFLRDTQTGSTALVSVRHSGGASADLDSLCYGLSSDGRYVAMVSAASDLVSGFVDGNLGGDDGFVRDLLAGTTELVTVNSAGTASGNLGVGTIFELSADGRRVFFDSAASDFVTNDANGVSDIFVRDRNLGTTQLVSVNATSTASANGPSTLPLSSANGRYVVFNSTASDLVPGFVDGNASTAADLYVRDVELGTTALVTVNTTGTASANAPSTSLEITPDGRYVVFTSAATDLVPNDTNGRSDIFVRDVVANVTRLVSVAAGSSASANGTSANGVPSADGRYVAFESAATDLITGFVDGNGAGRDVFVRDLTGGSTQLISVRRTGGGSADGASNRPFISADGGLVVFLSAAGDLVSPFVDGNGAFSDIFVRDRVYPGTVHVSRNAAGTAGANAALEPGEISRDGRVLGFSSTASDLVATDANGLTDVFVVLLPVTPRPTWTPTRTATATVTATPTPTSSGAVSGRIGSYGNPATPVPAATVMVTGPTSGSVGSDSSGQYVASPLAGGVWEIRPLKAGGVGASVSALDASWILQSVVGLRILSAQQALAGDVSGNGSVSALDAAMVLQRVVGLRGQFPAGAGCGSDWHFVPVPAQAANQTLLTPSTAGGACQHGAIRFEPLPGTVTGQDFLGIPIGDVTGNWNPGGG